MFSRSDLEFIAQLCVRHNVYVLSDEVCYKYQIMIFINISRFMLRKAGISSICRHVRAGHRTVKTCNSACCVRRRSLSLTDDIYEFDIWT